MDDLIDTCIHGSTTERNGDLVCTDCGLILNKIYKNCQLIIAESTLKISKNKTSQFSYPINMVTSQIGNTHIGRYGTVPYKGRMKDCHHKSIPFQNSLLYNRLKRWQNIYAKNDIPQPIKRTILKIHYICKHLDINTIVRDSASLLYRKIIKKEGHKKYYNNLVVGAYCILYSHRQLKALPPLTIKRLCEAFTLEGHTINSRRLNKVKRIFSEYFPNISIVASYNKRVAFYIEKTLKDIKDTCLKQSLILETQKLLSQIPSQKLSGKKPSGVIAASIYRAGKNLFIPITQEVIAEGCDITAATIRNRLKELNKFFDIKEVIN